MTMRVALSAFLVLLVSVIPSFADEREGQRSAEGEAGPRRSAEAEAGPRRSPEGERGARRSAEGAAREGDGALKGFKPQTEREAALFKMIQQLQREVAELRRSVQTRDGAREGTSREGRGREGVAESRNRSANTDQAPARWQNTKEGKVFKAYDKNGDQVVTLEEWLAMTNGNVSAARREIQTKRFKEAEPNGDGKFTPAEFIYWYSKGRYEAREGGQRGARDGEGSKRGPRDGE